MYLTSCSDNDGPQKVDATPLTLSVGLAGQPARAIIEETTLPEGSEIGLFLTDDGGSTYDGTAYSNILYTATGSGTSQAWDSDTDIMLSATAGTLYGYYPYSSTVTDITAVPVESASQTDYMYATPVTGVDMAQAQAQVTLNHALTAIKLTLTRGTYSGTGKVTNLSVTSDALATDASLDATTGELSAITGAGTAFAHDTDLTLAESAQSMTVTAVPTTATATVTITATVDGLTFTATAPADSYAAGYVYDFRLTVDDKAMTLTGSAVTPWATVSQGELAAIHDAWAAVETVDPSTLTGGPYAYAVAPDGSLVKDVASLTTEVAQQCIAVALITSNQRIWIEKFEDQGPNQTYAKANDSYESDTDYDYYFSWGGYGTDQGGITSYSTADEAKTDFNGKANSEVIKTILNNGTGDDYYTPMGVLLNTFNASNNTDNLGYTDWYIPAGGQLYEMYINITAVNNTLTAIGGTTISSNYYLSSSEDDFNYGWCVGLGYGSVNSYYKHNGSLMRLVRDF